MNKVKFAIPKGSLEKDTLKILERAWYKIYGSERTYRPLISDPEIELKILRPQEIPVSVSEGLHDVGITGEDWILETNAQVEKLLNLEYGRVKLVCAIPQSSPLNSLSDLLKAFHKDGKDLRIATEYLNLVSKYIKSNPIYKELYGDKEPLIVTPWWRKGNNSRVTIYLSFGATEAKPPEEADMIIDITETGTTLEQNKLKIIEKILESSAVLIANKEAMKDEWKCEKIYDILTLLKGVLDSDKKLHIFVNVKKENLNKLLKQLPALKKPTVSPLSQKGWYSVNTVIDKQEFQRLLPILRKLAQGLVVHEPQQILSLEDIFKKSGKD